MLSPPARYIRRTYNMPAGMPRCYRRRSRRPCSTRTQDNIPSYRYPPPHTTGYPFNGIQFPQQVAHTMTVDMTGSGTVFLNQCCRGDDGPRRHSFDLRVELRPYPAVPPAFCTVSHSATTFDDNNAPFHRSQVSKQSLEQNLPDTNIPLISAPPSCFGAGALQKEQNSICCPGTLGHRLSATCLPAFLTTIRPGAFAPVKRFISAIWTS